LQKVPHWFAQMLYQCDCPVICVIQHISFLASWVMPPVWIYGNLSMWVYDIYYRLVSADQWTRNSQQQPDNVSPICSVNVLYVKSCILHFVMYCFGVVLGQYSWHNVEFSKMGL
jgi:hypothetical protein